MQWNTRAKGAALVWRLRRWLVWAPPTPRQPAGFHRRAVSTRHWVVAQCSRSRCVRTWFGRTAWLLTVNALASIFWVVAPGDPRSRCRGWQPTQPLPSIRDSSSRAVSAAAGFCFRGPRQLIHRQAKTGQIALPSTAPWLGAWVFAESAR